MELKLTIKCAECNVENVIVKLIEPKSSVYLSSLIESQSSTIYCNVNYSNGMVVSCTCGNEIKVFI